MGVSVSRVRALTLDRWDNEGYEVCQPQARTPPAHATPRAG